MVKGLDTLLSTSESSVSASFVPTLIQEVERRGGTEADVLGLPKLELESVADFIVQKLHNIYRVEIDYSRPIEDMVIAGNYDCSNKSIHSENFPVPPQFRRLGRVKVNLHLIPCKKQISYKEALLMLKSFGLRPGILPEQLAIGAAFPQKQVECPIFQIGSLWPDRKGRRCTYLRKANKERMLAVAWTRYGFQPYYQIIAVDKRSDYLASV